MGVRFSEAEALRIEAKRLRRDRTTHQHLPDLLDAVAVLVERDDVAVRAVDTTGVIADLDRLEAAARRRERQSIKDGL